MTKLITPVLFSRHFGVSPDAIAAAGLFDPILNCDSKLFVDPLLFSSSDVRLMESEGHGLLRNHFSKVIKLVSVSKQSGDVAWRSAEKLLNLKERREICLGYGGSGTSGSSRPRAVVEQILSTAKQIVDLGESDPEIISLMGMFEEGVGPDTISDLSTNAIMPVLCQITQEFCKNHGIQVYEFPDFEGFALPANPYADDIPVVLVPRDVLRDLPLAADISDVSRVVLENERIRARINSYIANITKATVTEKKDAFKSAALESLENFREIFRAVLVASDSYDPQADPLGIYKLREVMGRDLAGFKQEGLKVGEPSAAELVRVVNQIVEHFRHAIEMNNLWELLWNGDKPRREKSAQLVFFGVADMFCRANNIDVAPETNPGGGPVDFRFSVGYHNRIIVEIKLSKGDVVHGYQHQTGIYAAASRTDAAIFLVVDVGSMGNKLKRIRALRAGLLKAGNPAPVIETVDARRRKSASVRESLGSVIDYDEDSLFDDEDGEGFTS